MTLIEIFSIIVIHWFADFLMQDEKWALGKSKNWNDLLDHTLTYSIIWLIIGFVIVFFKETPIESIRHLMNLFYFCLITFIAHTITDYFTSRIVSKRLPNIQIHKNNPTLLYYDQTISR